MMKYLKVVMVITLFVALGIPNIGKTASKTISKYFKGDWFKFENAILGGFDFTILDDFGQKMNDSIYNWYKFIKEPNVWAGLSYKMNFTELNIINSDISNQDNILNGKKVYATGSFTNLKKDEIQKIIESLGGIFASGYAKNLDYLIIGSLKSSGKEDKAKKDGINIMSEEEFCKIVKGE